MSALAIAIWTGVVAALVLNLGMWLGRRAAFREVHRSRSAAAVKAGATRAKRKQGKGTAWAAGERHENEVAPTDAEGAE